MTDNEWAAPRPATGPTLAPKRKISGWLVVGITAAVLVIIGTAVGKKPDDGGGDPNVERIRLRWNGLTGSEQADVCESVHTSGATATALRLGWPGTVDDVEWFLTELAC